MIARSWQTTGVCWSGSAKTADTEYRDIDCVMKNEILLPMLSVCAFLYSGQGLGDIAGEQLKGVRRIVFVGDSITYAGDYVVDFECWLLSKGYNVEVLNLGLSSETATDISEEENASHNKQHGFPRPLLSVRLSRLLAESRPDLLFACYGMNDSSVLPKGEEGIKRFCGAIEALRNEAEKAGVSAIVLCSPPIQDAGPGRGISDNDAKLESYASWMTLKKSDGWRVVDFHSPMRKALEEIRQREPAFRFAKDGVHPGREGHWLMAKQLIMQFMDAELDEKLESAENLFGDAEKGAEIRGLVKQRMAVLQAAWMTKIGHSRPGIPGGPGAKAGLSIEEADAKANELTEEIMERLK